MSYEPVGKVKPFIDAVRAEPTRIWAPEEIARLMEVQQSSVGSWMTYPMRAGVVHRGKRDGKVLYSGQPFPPEAAYPAAGERNRAEPAGEELTVPRFAGFVPPKMVAPRAGSEHPRVLATTPRPAPLGEPSPRPVGLCQGCGNPECVTSGCQDTAGPSVTPAAAPAPAVPVPAEAPEVAAAPAVHAEPELSNDEAPAAETDAEPDELAEAEESVPDAFISCRTGEIVLVGCPIDDEGRVTIPADLVTVIRRQIAWMPAPKEA